MEWGTRLSNLFYRFGNVIILLLSVVVFALFITTILPAEAQQSSVETGSNRSPDSSFFYSVDDLYSMAKEYGEEGRAAYIYSRFTFDIIWPLAYTFFLTAALSFLFRPLSSNWRVLNLLPLTAMSLDFLENISASIVMMRYPSSTPFIAQLTPFFTLLKWLCIYASFALLVIGIIYRIVHTIKKRSSS